MLADYVSILILFLFAVLLGGTFVAVSALIGRPKKKATELSPYECGIDQATIPRRPFSIKFFAVALMFLLFDVEVAVLYPWASLFRKLVSEGLGLFALVEGLLFIMVLAVGLIYIIRTGVLKWQ